MKTADDFNNLSISAFENASPRIFKSRDLDRAKELQLVTVADVLNDTHKGACKSMKAKLRQYPDAIVNAYDYFNYEFVLPKRISNSFTTAEMIKELFDEMDELAEIFKSIPFEGGTSAKESTLSASLKINKYRYIHNILEDNAISAELDNDTETCRTAHVRFINAIKSSLNEQNIICHPFELQFRLSELLINRINNVISTCTPGTSLKQITDLIGSKAKGIVKFFLDILDAYIYSSSNGTFKGDYILFGFPITGFDRYGSILFNDIMGNVHEHICDLQSRLHKRISGSHKKQIVDALVRMVNSSDQFDVDERNGLKYYRLKYEYLKNDDARNERILFDNRGSYLSKNEMVDIYNQRAQLYCMPEKNVDDYLLRSTEHIASQNGKWHWITDIEQKIADPRPIIKQYVQELGGIATLGQVKDFLDSKGIKLKDSSIRTYLNSFCKHSRGSETYTVKSSGSCCGRGDIIEHIISYLRNNNEAYISSIAKALSTTFQRVQRNINAHAELFVVMRKDNKIYVSLAHQSKLINITVPKTKSRKEPLHRSYMRSMAVDILMKTNGRTLPLKELCSQVGKVIAHTTLSKTVVYKVFNHPIFIKGNDTNNRSSKTVALNIDEYNRLYKENAEYAESSLLKTSADTKIGEQKEYNWEVDYKTLKSAVIEFVQRDPHSRYFDASKAFDEMNTIMMKGKTRLNRDSYYWLILELLFKYLTQKTTKIEREFLRDNLAYKYEPFLSDFYYKSTGSEIDETGLATRLGKLQGEGILPPRFSDWSSSYTTNLVKKRNRVHASNRDFDKTIKDDILQFVILYLYTAANKSQN